MALNKEDIETIYTIKFGPVGYPLAIYKERDTWISIQDHWKKLCYKVKRMKRDLENHFILELYINDFLYERRTTRKMYKVYRPVVGHSKYFFYRRKAFEYAKEKWLDGFFCIISQSTINIDGWYVIGSLVPFRKAKLIEKIEYDRYLKEHDIKGFLIIRQKMELSLINGRDYNVQY